MNNNYYLLMAFDKQNNLMNVYDTIKFDIYSHYLLHSVNGGKYFIHLYITRAHFDDKNNGAHCSRMQ